MSRHRHKPSGAALAERGRRLKTLQAELLEAVQLPDTAANRQRVEMVALIDMAMDNVREAILRGEVVEVGALERLAAARNSILPPPTADLTVHFIEERAPDLKLLSDQEFEQFSRLYDIGTGKTPPTERKKRSERLWEAAHLARTLDRAEQRDGKLTDKERIIAANAITNLLSVLEPIPYSLWNVVPQSAPPPQPQPAPAPASE
jgi:hypothetical protein